MTRVVEGADVVIIGGGVVGASVAWSLRREGFGGRIVIVERDPTYARASSFNATGGIRHQYGSELNVRMATYSARFYATFDETMGTPSRRPRSWFRQRGYLFLAGVGDEARFEARLERLRAAGSPIERWSVDRVRASIPDIVLDDVAFGIFGPQDGYLEPREVLAGWRGAAEHAGAEFTRGEVIGIERAGDAVSGVVVRSSESDGSQTATEIRIDAPMIVLAAGAFSSKVGALAGVDVPVVPLRQHLYRLALERPLDYRFPLTFDPTGLYLRHDDARDERAPEGLIFGRSKMDEPAGENFEVDMQTFEADLLPALHRRLPALSGARFVEARVGLYEMTPDHNGIVGEHPGLRGLIIAAGFSGHGLMMAPATGKAVAELITRGRSETFDVSKLSPGRFSRGELFFDDAFI